MKIIISVLLLFPSTVAHGQIRKQLAPVDSETCESGRQRALKRLSLGQICFPRYIFESSITLRKTLEIDYGILDELYDTLYDIGDQGELVCHDGIMKKTIDDKWGVNFLEDQRKIADNLDKKNIGFKEPRNRRVETSIKEYLTTNLKTHSTVYNYFALGVLFTISPNGLLLVADQQLFEE